jgi:isopenicillin N synthase-like dioxygenase
MRRSNKKIKSTMHRVCPPPTEAEGAFYPPRYSVAFFARPNPEMNIEALPGTWDMEEEKLYPAVNARDFIGGGFKDLYGGERVNNEMGMTVSDET